MTRTVTILLGTQKESLLAIVPPALLAVAAQSQMSEGYILLFIDEDVPTDSVIGMATTLRCVPEAGEAWLTGVTPDKLEAIISKFDS